MRSRVALLSLALSLSACATARVQAAGSPAGDAIPTRIENHSACDVRVRVYEEGLLVASERVTSQTAVRLRLVPHDKTHALRFVAEPFACGREYTVGTMTAVPAGIVVSIENAPNLSTVRGVIP